MKKIITVFLLSGILFSFAACGGNGNGESDIAEETNPQNVNEEITDDEVVSADNVTEETEMFDVSVTAVTDEPSSSENKDDKNEKEENSVPEKTTAKKSENPADWGKKEIVGFYKKAARNSEASVTSQHSISIKKISVNNGQFEGFFDFIMPIMSKLLANNSDDTPGITGGYINLSDSDIASARAYKSGKNIAVEMTMKEQVSGPRENAQSGSVGHVIDAVGDIGVVVDQLKDLGMPLELSEKDTKIYYTNPTVKVLVNSDGKIINGTWKYTVEIRMDNYKAFGTEVETTSVIMDNIVTVGGGFKGTP